MSKNARLTRIILTFRRQLREIELRVQREINEKRQELLAKEESLRWVSTVESHRREMIVLCNFVTNTTSRNLESRLAAQGSQPEFNRE